MNNEINGGVLLLNQKENQSNFFLYVLIFILAALILALRFVALLPIDGVSMEPNLHDKQYCLVQRTAFKVKRNDIVTIDTATDNADSHIIIKRVIATEGDKLIFMIDESGKYIDLYICERGSSNFVLKTEPYIKERMLKSANTNNKLNLLNYTSDLTSINLSTDSITESISNCMIEIPENSIFFLGDNRNVSRDSRYYGTRTTDKVISKVIYSFN